jgi:uncharacterized RDD family membrane protein YckC
MPYCTKCGKALAAEDKFCPKCGASITPEQTETPLHEADISATPDLKLASWGERFLAWLIDVVIIGLILGFLNLFSMFAVGSFAWWNNWPSWMPFFNFNVGGIVYFLYWLFMDGAYGQSLGKMIMRLRVVQQGGDKINMSEAAVESLGKAFLLPIDIIVGWIVYSQSKQRLFNRLSRTIVVRDGRILSEVRQH